MIKKSQSVFVLLALFFLSFAVSIPGSDQGLLLRSTFDSFSTVPDQAVDKRVLSGPSDIPSDLQLRMFPNIKGPGNSLCLQHLETVSYPLANFSPEAGTVSFWFCPQNYDLTEHDYTQVFFEVRQNENYRFIVYKPSDTENSVYFYLLIDGQPYTVQARLQNSKAGTWHHIAVTWDKMHLEIFADGKLAQPYQTRTFSKPLNLPAKISHCYLGLNQFNGWKKHPNWATAYDDLEIYDRRLTPKEISDKVEKYFPSNFASTIPPSLATIPIGNDVDIDGEINDQEWQDATMLPIANPLPHSSETELNFQTILFIKYTSEKLLAAFQVNYPSQCHDRAERDSDLWFNDSVDLLFTGPDGCLRHFIVNSVGALYDAKADSPSAPSENPRWNSNAQVRSALQSDLWSVELAIPLADLGFAKGEELSGQEMRGNFGVTMLAPHRNFHGWSRCFGFGTSYTTPDFFGHLLFGPASSRVRFSGLENLISPNLKLKLEAEKGFTAMLEWLSNSGPGGKVTEGLFTKGFETTRPAGLCLISLNVQNREKKTIYEQHIVEEVKKNLDIIYECQYLKQLLLIHIDYADFTKGTEYNGFCELIDEEDGKIHARQPFHGKSKKTTVEMRLPENLPLNGNFLVKASLETPKRIAAQKKFRTPEKMNYPPIAVDHQVPSPWHPVRSLDSGVFHVLEREYHFASGPLPSQIISRGQQMLKGVPQLFLNGSPVVWDSAVIGTNHGDYQEISGRGKVGSASFTCQGQLWFDGMYKFDLSLTASPEGLDISTLKLAWETPAEQAKYVMNPIFQPWNDGAIDLIWNTREQSSMLWTCGNELGLAWWNRSDANWIIDKNKKQVHLRRSDETVKIEIDIIVKKTRLEKTANYTMMLQGTPPRRPEKRWRDRHFGCSIPHSNFCMGSGGTAYGEPRADNLTYYTNLIPAHPEQFGAYFKMRHDKYNQDFVIYTFPPHISRMDRVYDMCYPTWATTPGVRWGAKDEFSGESFYTEPVCSNTPAADRQVEQAADLFAKYPYVYGIYFDISHVTSCDNQLHGHGGIDAFGQTFSCSIALELRNFFLRIYKLHRQYPDKYMMLHAHNKYYPFVHDFADSWCPGEEQFHNYCASPYWYYLEEIKPEEYQSAWNSQIRGVAVQMIPQEERAFKLMDSMKKHGEWIFTPETVIRRLSACMLHDIVSWECMWKLSKKHPLGILRGINNNLEMSKAIFHGYWFNNIVTTSNNNTKASWYEWDLRENTNCKRVIVIVNTSREETTPTLSINWQEFGLKKDQAKFYDLWNDQETSLDQINNTKIPGHHFLYIGIR